MRSERMDSLGGFFSFFVSHFIWYPTPTGLTYFWNFGSLAGFCLIIQIVSGLFLSAHYSASVELAFDSIEHIMRDVNNGWVLRYTHSNGASMFLFVVYVHMARGLYFKSYAAPRELLWYSGVLIFILIMATAFLGYVLPWGQMSFWGATVITNLASAIPIVGKSVAYWLWGGFSVDNATLVRFYSLHFLLPFLIAGLTILHISLLHSHGSSIALGVEDPIDFIPFYPYFLIKDVFGFFIFLFVFVFLVFFEPNLLGHPDNYIRANALVTPKHIVPEWYFLPFYAILRAVPSKLGGVVAMAASIGILFFMPLLSKSRSKKSNKTFFSLFFDLLCWIWSVDPTTRIKAPECRFYFTFFFSFFVSSFILLGVLGAKPIEYPYTGLSVVIGAYYFFFLIFADKF